jgi:hypothetical protein
MSVSTAEVRSWAKENGLDVADKGRLGPEVWSAFASAHSDPAPEPPSEGDEIVIDFDAPTSSASPEPPPSPAPPTTSSPAPSPAPSPARKEVPPQPAPRAKRSWWQRKEGEKPRRKRVSLEMLAGLAWQGIAGVVTSLAGPQYAPVGIMMSFQAPVAGAVLEDAARDTAADRLLQPVARLVQPGGQIGALLGAPLATAVVCRYPEMYPRMRPVLSYAMREWVTIAGPKLREMKRKENKFAEEMASFSDEFGMGIEELLDTVFAPLSGEPLAATNGHPG